METTTTTSQMQLDKEEREQQWQQQLLLLHATAAKRMGHRGHCRQIECPIFDISSFFFCSKCPIYNQRRAMPHVAAMYRILLFHLKLSALSTADESV